jgi:hypothetical protein
MVKDYPQFELMRPPVKDLNREQIHEVLADLKARDMKVRAYCRYTDDEVELTYDEMSSGDITMKSVTRDTFFDENRRVSVTISRGFIQDPYIIYCGSKKIGLVNYANAAMLNEERGKLFEDGKDINDYNAKQVETCMSYPWASRFLTGKLLIAMACATARERGLDLIETTSLFGKSIQYDRLPFLKMLCLTTGSTGAVYLFPHEFFTSLIEVLRTFYSGYLVEDKYFSKKKSALDATLKILGLDKQGYSCKNVMIKRGYYISILSDKLKGYSEKCLPPASNEEAIAYWRNKWLPKRNE